MGLILSLERCHRSVISQMGDELSHVGRAVCHSMPTPRTRPWLGALYFLWYLHDSLLGLLTVHSVERGGASISLRTTLPPLCVWLLPPESGCCWWKPGREHARVKVGISYSGHICLPRNQICVCSMDLPNGRTPGIIRITLWTRAPLVLWFANLKLDLRIHER